MCDLVQDFAKEYANQQVENRNISLAKKMLSNDEPLTKILDFSELSFEKIQELAKEMGKTIVA